MIRRSLDHRLVITTRAFPPSIPRDRNAANQHLLSCSVARANREPKPMPDLLEEPEGLPPLFSVKKMKITEGKKKGKKQNPTQGNHLSTRAATCFSGFFFTRAPVARTSRRRFSSHPKLCLRRQKDAQQSYLSLALKERQDLIRLKTPNFYLSYYAQTKCDQIRKTGCYLICEAMRTKYFNH